MDSSIITRVIAEMDDLPSDLQQQVLQFATALRQQYLRHSSNAWDVLESLAGTVEAPTDWSQEHDHYLYGTPKSGKTES
jgi:hypothetical protein